MFLNNRKRYAIWLKGQYHKWVKHRRKEDKEATISRIGLFSGLIVASVSVGFSAAGTWNILEQQSYNLLHQARRAFIARPAWDERVVIVAIDEASVDAFGRFPWPRDTHAQLLNKLWTAQPAAVSFGVLFPDATDRDGQLAGAIVSSDNVVLAVGTDSQGNRVDVTDTIDKDAHGFFLKGDTGHLSDEDGISRRLQLYGNNGMPSIGLATLQVYSEAIASTAQAVAIDDSDSVIAQTQHPQASMRTLLHASGQSIRARLHQMDNPFAPLPHASVRSANENAEENAEANAEAKYSSEKYGSKTENTPSPWAFLTKDGLPLHKSLWISWPGEVPRSYQAEEPGSLQIYSYADVLSNKVDTAQFQNKIVLVGSTLTGVDPLRTPFHKNPPVSGVYLYAATINNLLNQSFLRSLATWQTVLLLVSLSLLGCQLLKRQGAYWRLAVVVLFPVAWGLLAFGSFMAGWWIPVAAPIGTVVLSAIAVQVHEQQEKQQLMALFSMNVSPGTAELIWRNKGEILDQGELAAQKLTATVLFMDIRGFTGIAENMPSQQLLPWLNQYFETMTDCIMNHGGMVDKYIGDAIMAVFGAPVPRTSQEEIRADAIAALNASIEMHERLKLLNYHLSMQNLPTIQFGIGIHTGPLIGGTVGNRHRLNYSLFGDTVNVAARLESMTKTLPASAAYNVLISADTYNYAARSFPVELFRATCLRGRASQTEIYTLTGGMEKPSRRKTDRREPLVHPAFAEAVRTAEASSSRSLPAVSRAVS